MGVRGKDRGRLAAGGTETFDPVEHPQSEGQRDLQEPNLRHVEDQPQASGQMVEKVAPGTSSAKRQARPKWAHEQAFARGAASGSIHGQG